MLRRFRPGTGPGLSHRPECGPLSRLGDYARADTERLLDGVDSMNPNVPGEWFQCAIEVKSTGQMIGDLGMLTLADEPRQVNLGFTIAGEHRGHRYATDAVLRWFGYVFDDLDKH